MLKTNFKRFSSLGMALALGWTICSTALTSLAVEPTTESMAKEMLSNSADIAELPKTYIANVAEDLNAMEKHSIDLNRVSICEIDEDGNITYAYQILEDVTSYVDVNQSEDGSVSFHYVEGNLENTLRYTSDGKMYLDGYLVTFDRKANKTSIGDEITRAGGFYSYFFDAIPTGTTFSQYTGTRELFLSTGMIQFGQTIAGLTLGALAGVVITIYSGGNVSIGQVAANAVAGAVISGGLSLTQMQSTTASFVDYRNALKPQSSIEPKYRHDVTWTIAGQKLLPKYHYEIRTPI